MNLHVVAYPELSPGDFELVQKYRERYNSLYKVIAPHFTIVFSVPHIDLEAFSSEIKKQIEGIKAIPFCLRCAVINKDSFSDNYDAFLVPDEGFSQIVRLHDRLYADRLADEHRLDISYIPHLSIANSTDVKVIKRIVDEWNATQAPISGTISSLDIINYDRATRSIETVEKLVLS